MHILRHRPIKYTSVKSTVDSKPLHVRFSFFRFFKYSNTTVEAPPAKPAPTKDARDPYVLQKSFTRSLTLGGSTTDIVKLAFVLMYPWVGLKTLTLASWMNFDEKIEPTESV